MEILNLIAKENLIKIINKKENETIEYRKLSKKNHIYQNDISISNKEFSPINENISLALTFNR